MAELAIVGAKNSGKTTVLEGLITYLTGAGLRVATVKHTSHSHRFDTPGKDSFRHREAGAALTIARSEGETAIFARPEVLDIRRIQHMIDDIVDVWLIEGERMADRPKILVTRGLDESPDELPRNIIATIGPERLDDVSVHFDTEDYTGLGSFVVEIISKQKGGLHK